MANSFSRSELILGHDAMQKLAAARIAVFGVGGVGGYVVEARESARSISSTTTPCVLPILTVR